MQYPTKIILLAFWLLSMPCNSAVADSKKDAADKLYYAELESSVDLHRPCDHSDQFDYWLLDENGAIVKKTSDLAIFSEDLARTGQTDIAFIDKQGNPVFSDKFENTQRFAQGLCWVWKTNKINGYIDRTGAQVIKNADFYEGKQFSEGKAAVHVRMSPNEEYNGMIGSETPGKWGYIDRTGAFCIAPKYTMAEPFSGDRAAVKENGRWHLIDSKGNAVSAPFEKMGSCSESLCSVCSKNKWGYLSSNGKLVIPCAFDDAQQFSQGLAAVKIGTLYGFINGKGALVIKPQFKNVGRFVDDLCPVETSSEKWGFIDNQGVMRISPIFDEAHPFSCARAFIKMNGKVGFIDHSGGYVVKPDKYFFGHDYTCGRAGVYNPHWSSWRYREELMSRHLKGLKWRKDKTSPTGVYIPEDLGDALKELDSMLPAKAKQDMKIIDQKDMIAYHFWFGMGLRNDWGLWKGLRLAKYFNSVGIFHPDDMSGTLFDAYWSRLHSKKFDIAAEAAKYREYAEKMKPVVKEKIPLPASIQEIALKDSTGQSSTIKDLLDRADISVLALCTTDEIEPALQKTIEELRKDYSASKLGFIAASNFDQSDEESGKERAIQSNQKITERKTYLAPEPLYAGIKSLFKLDALVIPQILVIERHGTVVLRLNGY